MSRSILLIHCHDLGRFLDLVAAEGMDAIGRPGPYICAEWHNGGLPVWLTRDERIRLRSSDPLFLAEVGAFLRRVYAIVAPRQIDRGGPVVEGAAVAGRHRAVGAEGRMER